MMTNTQKLVDYAKDRGLQLGFGCLPCHNNKMIFGVDIADPKNNQRRSGVSRSFPVNQHPADCYDAVSARLLEMIAA